jgi:purine-nucleoside phosphorylase
MPLIITPKTYSQTKNIIIDYFKAYKSEANFWHSNFKDYFYRAKYKEKELFFLFTGYSELAISSGIIHAYDKLLRKLDNDPRAIYIGACFVTAQSEADLGDIVIPTSAISKSEVAKEIAKKIEETKYKGYLRKIIKMIAGMFSEREFVWKFDEEMRRKLVDSAKRRGIKVYEGKILCKESFSEDFWFPFGEKWGYKKGYIGGEVEAGAFVASCHYIGVPSVALEWVKDKKKGDYKIASDEKQIKALKNILVLIDDLLCM